MNALESLFESGLLSALDISFAKLMTRLSGLEGERAEHLSLLTAMLSQSCSSGKSARLDLRSLSQEALVKLFKTCELETQAAQEALSFFAEMTPDGWLSLLKEAPLIAAPAEPGALKPIVFEETEQALYLLRLWHSERRVAQSLTARAGRVSGVHADASGMLSRIFPLYAPVEPDLQKAAAETVASGALSIITGGPGTGKTSSVAAALCALLAVKPELRIGLCAPTGKAAAQLLSSINSQRELFKSKGVAEELLARLPEEAHTIHRILQWSPSRGRYGRNAGNQLDLDVLVVDEASMMSLSQTDSLLSATPDDCLLILLGDKDQLASVEAGSVFADLCARISSEADAPFKLAPRVAGLKRVHRFAEGGALAELKDAINAQAPDEAWRILSEGRTGLSLLPVMDASPNRMRESLRATLRGIYEGEAFRDYLKQDSPEKSFALFESFRVLCSNRGGIFGVDSVNTMFLEFAFGEGATLARNGVAGLPVAIAKNSYGLGLYNGDVGLVLPSEDGVAAFFRTPDGFKSCPIPLLPEHDIAFALTVHKAQGSGFDHALLILPPAPDNPLLTKELLYTAVTRAKERLTVICSEESFKAAVVKRTERSSGLAALLG